MKNVSKWSLCFRPPATIEIDDGVDCSADRMLSLIAAARNSNRLNNNKKKQDKKKKSTKKNLPEPSPPTLRRSFSSVVRAVVFETSLSRRVRESKLSRNRSDQSSLRLPPSDLEPLTAADRTVEKPKPKPNSKAESKPESAIAPDSKKSVSNPPASENAIRSEIGGGSAVRINPVVCLILLSLCVTVFLGKAFAVMTTTIGIYAWRSGVVVVGLGEVIRLKEERPWKKVVKLKRGPTVSVHRETK